MAEPPSKKLKRTDGAARKDNRENMASAKSPRRETSRERKHKTSSRHQNSETTEKSYRDGYRDERRRRSRSKDRHHNRRERSTSRQRETRGKDRDHDRDPVREDRKERHRERDQDRNRNRDQEHDRDRLHRSRRDRDPSRSPVKIKSSRASKTVTEQERRRHRSRSRTRSRSPARNGAQAPVRTRSPPKGPRPSQRTASPARGRSEKKAPVDAMEVDAKPNGHVPPEDENSEDALMRKMMGFSTFKSTQNKKIPGNNVYGVRKEKITQYRQYMNRTGGFNRPLSPSREE